MQYVQHRTPAAETRSARKRRLDKNEKASQYAAKKAARVVLGRRKEFDAQAAIARFKARASAGESEW